MLHYFLIAFVIVDIFIVIYIINKRRKKEFSKSEIKYFQNHWNQIKKHLDSHPNNAVLEADKLVDQAMNKKGLNGSFGEKLKKHPTLFSDLNGIWSAHKLRNRIAHELNTKISVKEGQNALSQFNKALRDLGLLLRE